VLALIVAGAAIATLLVARQGFTSVDASSQLRENARFAASLIERVVVEAGFENAAYGLITDPKEPGLRGFNNSLITGPVTLPLAMTHDSRSTSACGGSDTACLNGSDVLVVRYWGANRGAVADGTIVNCAGIAEPEAPAAQGPAYSIFHVQVSSGGEPTLVCSYRDPATLVWSTVPLVQGVESFQVLYGTDAVAPGACAATASDATSDSVAERFLTAAQLDVGGVYCPNNWSRVRSVRIGILLRGAAGSAVTRVAGSWPVLSASGANYTFAAAADYGSTLAVPADGRLRKQMVFTVHLRNAQYAP
jgi:type IV pilus assembly protein PilW